MKVEATHGERFKTRERMRRALLDYIEVDYEGIRRHSANGYLSSAGFEALKVT
jgi:putative transposase